MSQLRTRHPHRSGVVIIGGGLAGQRCAETLRRNGYDAPIRMVCAEPHRPYDRPPLSKQLLAGAASGDPPAYRPAEWYRRESIELLLGVAATELLPTERRVVLSDGTALHYDRLLIATGSRPRELSLLAGYENVWSLRTLDDCRALRQVVGAGRRLVVVGGGFIGLEVAATARGLGAEVTIIEAAATALAPAPGAVPRRREALRCHSASGQRRRPPRTSRTPTRTRSGPVAACNVTAADGNANSSSRSGFGTGLVRPRIVSKQDPSCAPAQRRVDRARPRSSPAASRRFSRRVGGEQRGEADTVRATAGVKKNALNGSTLRRSRVGIRAMSPVTFFSADASTDGRPVRIAPDRSAASSR